MRIDFDRMTVICLGQFHVLESSLSVFDVRISLITILRFTGSIDLKKFAHRASARGIYSKPVLPKVNIYLGINLYYFLQRTMTQIVCQYLSRNDIP